MKPTATVIIAALIALGLLGACSESDESERQEGHVEDQEGQVLPTEVTVPESVAVRTNSPVPPGPAIKFEKPSHDFGKITVGDLKTYAFSFTNTGDQPLLVTEVTTSCGCTTAGQWTREVAPGKTGQVPIQLDSKRFDGPLRKSVSVVSNAINHAVSTLQLEADVWTPVKVEPRYAAFDAASRAARETKLVTIRNMDASPLALSDFAITGEKFDASLRTVTPGKEYEVVITTVPPLDFGLNRGDVTLKTSNALVPEIKIAVHGNVRSPITVSPSKIALPSGKLPTTLTRIVNVRGEPGKNLSLSEPITGLEGIKVKFLPVRAGEHFQLIAEFPMGFEVPGGGTFSVKANTNYADAATIDIPITSAPSITSRPSTQPRSLFPEPGESTSRFPSPPKNSPDIRFESTSHDFGEATAGQNLAAEFVFTNKGTGTLTISGVKINCGCITAGDWDREVGPGKQGRIPISLDPSSFRGPLNKHIIVSSNDPAQPTTTLSIQAQIWNPVEVVPRFAAFGVIHDTGAPLKRTIRIVNHEKEPLLLSEPKTDNDVFKVVLKTIQPGKEFQLLIETSSALVEGTHRGSVTVRTSSASVPELSIVAHASVVGPLQLSPAQIVVPGAKTVNPMTRHVMVHNNLKEKISVTVAEAQPGGISASIRETRPGKQFRVELKFPADFEIPAGGPLAITLTTDHAEYPTLSIPVVEANGPGSVPSK